LVARCYFKNKDYLKALDALDLQNKNIQPGQQIRTSNWEPSDPQNTVSTILLEN